MFSRKSLRGNAFDTDYLKLRAKWEKITEITQIKGDSETHSLLSPNDEFADFEGEFKHLLGTGGVVGKVNNSFFRAAIIDGVGAR